LGFAAASARLAFEAGDLTPELAELTLACHNLVVGLAKLADRVRVVTAIAPKEKSPTPASRNLVMQRFMWCSFQTDDVRRTAARRPLSPALAPPSFLVGELDLAAVVRALAT